MVCWESYSSRPTWKGYQSKRVANHSNCCDVRWNVCNGTYSWLEKDVEDFEKTVGMCSNAIFAISGKLYTNVTLIGQSTSRLDYNTIGCRLFFTISAFFFVSKFETNQRLECSKMTDFYQVKHFLPFCGWDISDLRISFEKNITVLSFMVLIHIRLA